MGLSIRKRTKGKDSWINYSISKKGIHGSYSHKLGENTTINIGPNGNKLTYNFGNGLRWTTSSNSGKKNKYVDQSYDVSDEPEISADTCDMTHYVEQKYIKNVLLAEYSDVCNRYIEAGKLLDFSVGAQNTVAHLTAYYNSMYAFYTKSYQLLNHIDIAPSRDPKNFAGEPISAQARFSELKEHIMALDTHIEKLSTYEWPRANILPNLQNIREQMLYELKMIVQDWTKEPSIFKKMLNITKNMFT